MSAKSKTLSFNIQYAALQGVYWLTFCACVAFAAVYMQHRGYTNSVIGVTLALGNIVGVILSAVLASLADRRGRAGLFGALIGLLLAALAFQGIFILVRSTSPLVLAGYCLYVACVNAGGGLTTQLSAELAHSCGHINFGAARGTGSLFYSLSATIIGLLLEKFTPAALPGAAIFGLAVQALIIAALAVQLRRAADVVPVSSGAAEASGLLDFFRGNKRFCYMMLGTVLLYFSHNVLTNFFINVVRADGGDTADLGRITGFMAIIEIPVLLFYDRFTRRISAPACMRIAAVGFVAKAFAFALAPNVPALYAASILQTVSFALITPASVRYVSLYISASDAAKGQSVAFGVTTLASIFATSIGGVLFDAMSARAVLLISAVVASVGAVATIAFSKPESAA